MPARPMLDVHYSTGRGRYEPVRSGRPTRQSRRTPRSRPPGPRGQGSCLRSGPDARPSAAAAWSDREGRRRPSPGRPLAGPRSAPDQRARPASASLRRPAAAAPANSLWGPFRARPPARDDGTRRSARPRWTPCSARCISCSAPAIGPSIFTRSCIVPVRRSTDSVSGPTDVASVSITSTWCSIDSVARSSALTPSSVSRSVSSSGLKASSFTARTTDRIGLNTKSNTAAECYWRGPGPTMCSNRP